MSNLSAFDPAEYLDTPEANAEYLADALDTGDSAFIAHAVGVIARARGMSKLAQDIGVSRQSLYKSLSAQGRPEFATILKVVNALGLELSVKPATPSPNQVRTATT